MNRSSLRAGWATCAWGLGLSFLATSAQAGVGKELVVGLESLGVQFSGERNPYGNGITLNGNASYANTKYNFGLSDLTLTGSVAGSLALTNRTLPAAQFSLNTGNAPLAYTYRFNSGAQDFTASGNVAINVESSINALGFYDQKFLISNRGTFETDGFLVRDSGTLDFDAGPVNLSGNVFVDAAAAISQPFFAATGTINPFSKFTGRATKEAEASQTADELRSRVEAGEVLTDDEIAALVNNTVLAAILGGQPTDHLFDSFILPAGVLQDGPMQFSADFKAAGIVPEPGTLSLLALASVLILPRRRVR